MARIDPPASGTATFALRFEARYRALALPYGITPARAWVRIGGGRFVARYGPWQVSTSTENLAHAEVTGPYALVRTAGPARLSFADGGLTFASNGAQGVCIGFRTPVAGLDPLGVLRHPSLTVTVEDIEGLCQAIDGL